MVVRISDKTQNYSKVTKLLVKPNSFIKEHVLYMQCDSKEEFSKSLQILIQNDILVYSLAEVHQDLETYYKELYKG